MRLSRRLAAVAVAAILMATTLAPTLASAAKNYQPIDMWPDGLILQSPRGVGVDASGNIYVADTGNSQIKKLSSSGALLAVFGSPGSGAGQYDAPLGVVVGGDALYVADSGNDRIQKVSLTTGQQLAVWGTTGTGAGQFDGPSAVAYGPDGFVYVSDSRNNRIQKFDASGNHVLTFGSQGYLGGQFMGPAGLTVVGTSVFVADSGNDRIQRFTTDGVFETWWGGGVQSGEQLPDPRYRSPKAVVADSAGNLYVLDSEHGRVEKCDQNGTLLSTWGSLGRGPDQLLSPEAMTVRADGRMIIADTGNGRLQVRDASGAVPSDWSISGSAPGTLDTPNDAAVSASGDVYVTDSGNQRVQKFSATGAYVSTWGTAGGSAGQFMSPRGIALDASGNVYVVDSGNGRVQKFTAAGAFLESWGTPGTASGQFLAPTGIALDPSGNIFVADTGNNRVQKLSPSGTVLTLWGVEGTGASEFSAPSGIAVDSAGNVYVTDTGNSRVQKFTNTGAPVTRWGFRGSGAGQFASPQGITVMPDGGVVVADTGNHRVQEFTSTGAFVAAWGSEGQALGQMRLPAGVTNDPAGQVLVVESGNHRVQRFADANRDVTPPTTGVSGAPAGWTNGAVQLTLSATDVGVGVGNTYYRVGSTGDRVYQGAFTVSGEGTTVVSFWSTDLLGHVEGVKSVSVRIDRGLPSTRVSGSPVGWSSSNVTLHFTATDAMTGVAATSYRIGSGPVQQVVGGQATIATEGSNVVTYWSTDRVGNVESPRTETVRIDKSPAVTSGAADGAWRKGSSVVTLTATDSLSGPAVTMYRLGEGTAQTYTGPVSVVHEGVTVVTYYTVDNAGNWESEKSLTVRVDGSAPRTTANVDDRWYSSQVPFVLTASDLYTGVAGTYYRVGNGPQQSYTGTVTISTEGTTTVSYWSVDGVGNREDTRTATVHIWTAGPRTTCNTDDAWHARSFTVMLQADTDEGSITGTYYRIGSGPTLAYTGPFVIDTPGTTEIHYWSTDSSGDEEPERTAYVRVSMPVSLTLSRPSQGSAYGASVKLSGKVSPAAATPVVVQSSANGVSGWSKVATASVTPSGVCIAYVRPTAKTYYRLSFAEALPYLAAVSNTVYTQPKASMGTPYVASSVVRGRYFTASGSLKPRHAARQYSVKLYFYQYVRGRWVYRTSVSAVNANYSTYTKYSRSTRLSYPGRWRVRAYHADAGHAATYTGYRYFTVR